jgi:hypothetical protein
VANIRQFHERKRAMNSESFLGRTLQIATPATTGEYDDDTYSGAPHRGHCGGDFDFDRSSPVGGVTAQVRL